jgi:hypothetical protein
MQTDYSVPFVAILFGTIVSSLILSLLLRRLSKNHQNESLMRSPIFIVILSIGVFFLISGWSIMIIRTPALMIAFVTILLVAVFISALVGILVLPSSI